MREEWHPRNPGVTGSTSLYEEDREPSFAEAIGNDTTSGSSTENNIIIFTVDIDKRASREA
jgi:hypothetical protein